MVSIREKAKKSDRAECGGGGIFSEKVGKNLLYVQSAYRLVGEILADAGGCFFFCGYGKYEAFVTFAVCFG